MTVTRWPGPIQAEPAVPGEPGAGSGASRRVVWKFGGTSVGDAGRLRAVARRLVAARRAGLQVVAVLSAMGKTTDQLVRQAYGLSAEPQPRELDALLSVGEVTSCALTAIAVHELGERAVSLTGSQAGILTDHSHGNARLQQICPDRITQALDDGAIVLVAGFQGISGTGDVTTLGRGGSDATAIALAAVLGAGECGIFTDVPGVFTADPRVVSNARQLAAVSHEEMLQLADAGARVMQTRAVELAAAHGIDIHVRSSFTSEPGTWIRRRASSLEGQRVAGIAHTAHDPLYTVSGRSPALVSAALAARGLATGLIQPGDGNVQFTAPGTGSAQVAAALAAMDLDVSVREDLGSVSVVSAMVVNRSDVTATALSALETSGIHPQLITCLPNRVCCHVPAAEVGRAAQVLHDAFQLDAGQEHDSQQHDSQEHDSQEHDSQEHDTREHGGRAEAGLPCAA
jgi:aspartate kinase